MKNLLPLLFLGFSMGGHSQVNTVMPPEADLFYNNAMQTIRPQLRSAIEKNANNLKDRRMNTDSLLNILRTDAVLKNKAQQEIDAVAVLIMVQASKNADADLKNMVMTIQKSYGEISRPDDPNSIKLKAILNNKSQIAEHISILMDKLSGQQNLVIDHLK